MLTAQTTTDNLSFEAATVKPTSLHHGNERSSGDRLFTDVMVFKGGPGSSDPGRIRYTGATLQALLARAYNVRSFQISGPAWLDTERYELIATLPPGTDSEKLRAMLQKLLVGRFHVSLHRERKELPVYNLTIAKNGPKLKPPQTVTAHESGVDDQTKAGENAVAALGAVMRGDMPSRTSTLKLPSGDVSRFAALLSYRLNHPIIDLTALKGVYAFNLSWTPDDGISLGGKEHRGVADAPSGPSVFAAVQEQLGLKLTPGKGMVEVLVIDKAEKSPDPN